MDKQLLKELRSIDWGQYDLQRDLHVDKFALDVAAVQQPVLIAKWNSLYAMATTERDKAKEALAVQDARLQKRARAGELKAERLTEGAVKAWVKAHPEYLKSAKKLRATDSNVTYVLAAVKAIDAKKYMILELAKLFLSDYYSETRIHSNAEKKTQQHRAQDMKSKLNKTMSKKDKE